MKRLISFTTMWFMLSVVACTKDANSSHALTGSWELRSIYGGYGPGGGNYEPGNGNIYIFTNGSYSYYVNHVLQDSGNYMITQGVNPNTGENMSAILFDSLYTIPYSIDNNKLKLYSGAVAADGTIATYERIAH